MADAQCGRQERPVQGRGAQERWQRSWRASSFSRFALRILTDGASWSMSPRVCAGWDGRVGFLLPGTYYLC